MKSPGYCKLCRELEFSMFDGKLAETEEEHEKACIIARCLHPAFYNVPSCNCGSGKYAERQYDACGIYLTRTCEDCHSKRMREFRPEILTGYTQSDVDEPIEPEDC